MTKIVAQGVPQHDFVKDFGPVTITVTGDEVTIYDIKFEYENDEYGINAMLAREWFDRDMERGPHYPLCAEPHTMRRALFILYAWFGEEDSVWIKEPEHVKVVEGEVEPMPSEPGVIY